MDLSRSDQLHRRAVSTRAMAKFTQGLSAGVVVGANGQTCRLMSLSCKLSTDLTVSEVGCADDAVVQWAHHAG